MTRVREVGVAGALDPRVIPLLPPADVPAPETLPVATFREGISEIVLASAGEAVDVHSVSDVMIPTDDGAIPARVYEAEADDSAPTLVYFHGGGWVVLGLESHDSACRSLCARAGCRVVSVDYRLAPEHRYPAAAHDCYAATRWVADELGASRIAVGGDSAGGNLAAVTALMARDMGGPDIALQALLYPVTNVASFDTDSYAEYATGHGLTASLMRWFGAQYAGAVGAESDPYVSPLLAPNLAGLPPALVITAEFDVLRDEGEAYASKLAAAGVQTDCVRYNGMHHGFFIMDGPLPQASAAQGEAAAALRAAFQA